MKMVTLNDKNGIVTAFIATIPLEVITLIPASNPYKTTILGCAPLISVLWFIAIIQIRKVFGNLALKWACSRLRRHCCLGLKDEMLSDEVRQQLVNKYREVYLQRLDDFVDQCEQSRHRVNQLSNQPQKMLDKNMRLILQRQNGMPKVVDGAEPAVG